MDLVVKFSPNKQIERRWQAMQTCAHDRREEDKQTCEFETGDPNSRTQLAIHPTLGWETKQNRILIKSVLGKTGSRHSLL